MFHTCMLDLDSIYSRRTSYASFSISILLKPLSVSKYIIVNNRNDKNIHFISNFDLSMFELYQQVIDHNFQVVHHLIVVIHPFLLDVHH